MAEPGQSFQKGDALLIVDVQKDFCPGGALPIEDADKVVPILNQWIKAAREKGIPIYASRDWHPIQHMSFQGQGGKWPPHCMQDSDGAMFHPDLDLPDDVVKITKGVRFDHDQYSVFDQSGLADQLKRDAVKHLWVGGLAQDVCVLESVLDARNAGFEVYVLREATRPVTPEGGEGAIRKMKDMGAKIVE
jgi:nicotinamidase/pyrazinamidase